MILINSKLFHQQIDQVFQIPIMEYLLLNAETNPIIK